MHVAVATPASATTAVVLGRVSHMFRALFQHIRVVNHRGFLQEESLYLTCTIWKKNIGAEMTSNSATITGSETTEPRSSH